MNDLSSKVFNGVKYLMLSTDRKILDSDSMVWKRMQQYATFCESLVIIVAGTGEARVVDEGKMRIVFPGGYTKIDNFVRMVIAARKEPATITSAQDPFWTGLVGVVSGKRPLQIQLHTDHFGFVGTVLAAISLRSASCVRVVSERLKRKVRYFTNAPVTVLPIWVDVQKFKTEYPRPAVFGAYPVILTVSRLSAEKQLDLVIRTVRDVLFAHLFIIGDGLEKGALEKLVTKLNLSDRVHFLGWHNDVAAYYQHADCFVQASKYEGYGVSLVEALVSGCPAVSTDVGVARELPKGAVTIAPTSEYGLSRALSTTLHLVEAREQVRAAREAFLHSMPSEAEYLERYKQSLTSCGI